MMTEETKTLEFVTVVMEGAKVGDNIGYHEVAVDGDDPDMLESWGGEAIVIHVSDDIVQNTPSIYGDRPCRDRARIEKATRN